MTGQELHHRFNLQKAAHSPALKGELWGVFSEDLWENWMHCNGTALYFKAIEGYLDELNLLFS